MELKVIMPLVRGFIMRPPQIAQDALPMGGGFYSIFIVDLRGFYSIWKIMSTQKRILVYAGLNPRT